MSSLALFGVCAAAVRVCIAATHKGAKLTVDGVNWLAESGKRELEKLEKALAENRKLDINPEAMDDKTEIFLTTTQARNEYREIYKKARQLAKDNALLAKQQDAVAHFLAARHSTLGKFLEPAEAAQLDMAAYSKAATEKILRQASQRFVKVNRDIIIQGFKEAASEAGFAEERLTQQREGRQYVVMSGASGKALVAEISTTKLGDISANIDLVGFTDDSCHQVMTDIVSRLREKNILLDESRQQDHFQFLGEILPKLRTRKQYRESQPEDSRKEKRRTIPKQKRKTGA